MPVDPFTGLGPDRFRPIIGAHANIAGDPRPIGPGPPVPAM